MLGAVASLLRGGKYHYVESETVVGPRAAPVEARVAALVGVAEASDEAEVSAQEAVAETEPLLVD